MAASKLKTTYICSECGYESLKWLGHCPSCGEWNTFVEEVVNTSKEKGRSVVSSLRSKPVLIKDIVLNDKEIRIKTGDTEFDRVMGGGIVSGSIVLVGGEPGIGKSTLMLQVAVKLSGLKILYVSGEESQQQIKMRYDRIGNSDKNNI
ncbi:MAG: AAA family ATPase, partial [Bacteroidales bacterium]|nr:AAA family ATPase [Bacteroidales bacterium]